MVLESIVLLSLLSIALGLSMLTSFLLEPKVHAGSRFDLTGTRLGEAVTCAYCGVASIAFNDDGQQVHADRCQKCGAWR